MVLSNERKPESIYSNIVSDVVFDHISLQLLGRQIITVDEYKIIKTKEHEVDQMITLLDTLRQKEQKDFKQFVDVLKVDYKWIADELEVNNVNIKNFTIPKQSKISKGLTNEMIKLVQKNHRVADKWTIVAHSLGLSRHVNDIRVKVNMCGEPNSMSIVYLLQEWIGVSSKNATLNHLIQVFREQDFNDIADELEEKFT